MPVSPPPRSSPTRRDVLTAIGAAALGAGLGGLLPASVNAQETSTQKSPDVIPRDGRRRAIRIAHLTDMHIQPERQADQGVAACLRHMQGLPDKPELVLTGGDTVMDSFEASHARTKLQWELWQKVLKGECGLPVQSCIGNHDIWGWHKGKSGTTGDEPGYGKKWVLEIFARATPWTSFDRAGWHFIILDSTQPDGDGYLAYLDEEQFAWLESDLKATRPETPVLVLSHIPILSVAVLAGWQRVKDRKYELGGSLLHTDAPRLKNLFRKHPNVKVCLSGHLHLVDRCEYLGVTYLCNGAVSGAWWRGDHQECKPGYAVVDLFSDGSFENQYIPYGWQAVEAQRRPLRLTRRRPLVS